MPWQIGLLDELFHTVGVMANGFAPANVTKACFRTIRANAKSDEPSVARQDECGGHGIHEISGVAYQVIGWQHQQHGIGISRQRLQRAQRDSRCCVTCNGLQHDRGALDARLEQLLGRQETVIFAGHHDRCANAG